MGLFKAMVAALLIVAGVFTVAIGTVRLLEGRNPFTGAKPAHVAKYKAGDCIAYYMNGKHFEAKEEWEVSRDVPAFATFEIVKVGKEKYLVNTRYWGGPAPYRPNQSESIRWIDTNKEYEKIDCANVESVLRRLDD